VNFRAFDSRFFRICCTRCSSVVRASGAPWSTVTAKFSACWSAIGRNTCSRSSHSDCTFTGAMAMSIFPASTFDRSRMSLIRLRRSLPAS
jgi:hypothetical protein